ncbi:MAG TPA: sigma-70 family RNA polymerase sigma factor [Terracidiphilus sp.]|jgi:RNA polymerase sigma-70 factor (ECF subfamily)
MNKPTNYTDLQLVNLAREGDQQAFGALAQRHWRQCVAIGSNFLRDREEAKDQAQNAILKAYLHLDQLQSRDEAGFAKWLGRIVVSECRMLMRSRRRERFVFLDETYPGSKRVRSQLRSSDRDPERTFACLELNQLLKSEMKRIPPFLRDVLSLRYLQGLSRRQAARTLGVDIEALRSRLRRGRAELRVRMEARCGKVGVKDAIG